MNQQKQKATEALKASIRQAIEQSSSQLSNRLVTESALIGRDGTQRCAGCGTPTHMDKLFYVTPDPLTPCEFYCKMCKEEMNCVDPFAPRNY